MGGTIVKAEWGFGNDLNATFILQYPESTTYMMPSRVSDVSAMLVATTHLRRPPGAFWKILACRSEGNWE